MAAAVVLLFTAVLPAGFAAVRINLLSQWGGRAEAFTIAGTRACVALDSHVVIVDLSQPAAPVALGQSPVFDRPLAAVAMMGEYVYAGDWDGLVHILQVSNPAAPIEVGTFHTNVDITEIVIIGSTAYVAGGYDGALLILDLSNPTAPYIAGRCTLAA